MIDYETTCERLEAKKVNYVIIQIKELFQSSVIEKDEADH